MGGALVHPVYGLPFPRKGERMFEVGDAVLLDEQCKFQVPISLKECEWPQKVTETRGPPEQLVRLENGLLYLSCRFKKA